MKKIGLLCIAQVFLVAASLWLTVPTGDEHTLSSFVPLADSQGSADASIWLSVMSPRLPIAYADEQDPELTLQLGIVATNNANAVFSKPLPATAVFSKPGAIPSWAGTLNSTQLISTPVTSDIDGLDGNDRVTFAVVIQNLGGGGVNLSDLHVQGVLPTSLITQTEISDLNIQGRNGQGEALKVDLLDGGLFGEGVVVNHLDEDESVVEAYDSLSGENLAILTFDLTIHDSVMPSTSLPIALRIIGYSFQADGDTIVAEFPLDNIVDDAEILIAMPEISATVVNVSQVHASDQITNALPVAIGDIITYEVTLLLPEGRSPEGFLKSEMDQGFALVDVLSVEASANVTTDVAGGFAGVRDSVRLIEVENPLPNHGQKFDLFFGELTVQNEDPASSSGPPGIVRMRYQVVALNNDKNFRDDDEPLRNQYLQWCWSVDHHLITGHSPDAYIVEPELQIQQTISPTTAVAGDTVTVTLSIEHSAESTATAHDVTIRDLLPAELSYVEDSLRWIQNEPATNITPTAMTVITSSTSLLQAQDSDGGILPSSTIAVSWRTFPLNSASRIQFQAELNAELLPQSLEDRTVEVMNSAQLMWSSVAGEHNQGLSTYHDLAAERTGDSSNVGGDLNDYRAVSSASVMLDIPATAPESARIDADLSVENLTRSVGPVRSGDTLRYKLVVRNIGDRPALNVQLSNRLEGNLALMSASVTLSQGALDSVLKDGDPILVASLGSMAPGDVAQIEYDAVVSTPLLIGTSHVANQALIYGDNFALTASNDPATLERSDPTLAYLDDAPRLVAFNSVELTVDADDNQRISAGDTVSYLIDVKNRGHGIAEGVTFYNRIDEGAALVIDSVEAISGTVTAGLEPGEPTLEVSLGQLAASQTKQVRFSTVVNGLFLSRIQSVGSQGIAFADNHPAILTDDPATLTMADATMVSLSDAPSVVATKQHHLFDDKDGSGTPSAGDLIAYLVTLQNFGSDSATDLSYIDDVDSATAFVDGSFRTTRADVALSESLLPDSATTRLTATLPQLGEAGLFDADIIYMSYLVEVLDANEDSDGTIRNQGVITGTGITPLVTHDPVRSIPGMMTETFIDLVPRVEMVKHDILILDIDGDGMLSPPNGNIQRDRLLYQIRLSNLGNTTALSADLEDTLDSHARLIPGTVRTNRGDIVVGSSADSENVIIELGPMGRQQVAGAAEGATISFEVELEETDAPRPIINVANILVNIDNKDTDLEGQYTLVSDDPETEALNDPTITSVSIPPTDLNLNEEPTHNGAVVNPMIYLPLY